MYYEKSSPAISDNNNPKKQDATGWRRMAFLLAFCCGLAATSFAQPVPQRDRWQIQPDGSILWNIDNRLPHQDHIEMSGEKVSCWVQYGIDTAGRLHLDRTMVFPGFRLLPQRTIASMMYNVTDYDLPRVLINDKLMRSGVYNASVAADMPERVIHVRHRGVMEVHSLIGKGNDLLLKRTLFPSTDKPMVIEKMVFVNNGKQPVKIEMEYLRRTVKPAVERATPSQHSFVVTTVGEGLKTVAPGDSAAFALTYQAVRNDDKVIDAEMVAEQAARQLRVAHIQAKLRLETPDTLLNTAFDFAKLRATESIYLTKGGYLHGPGGLRYYAAIWANDQAEYINPFFAFLGDDIGNRSAMNAYRWFAHYMNPAYKPIPSSIIAEGDGIWHGAKDRGDMAMIAYGAGRYALALGQADSARVLWPLIEWCLEYERRQLNDQGVVLSNSDELEGRFPAGKANLNTSVLYYDALRSAVMLGKQLSIDKAQWTKYQQQATVLRGNIEKYFGATVEGFKTYRYYEGNDTLRAWICSPLIMDILDRKEGTIAALFSPRLWTEDGLASLAGNQTFWDRSTLYALRGVFAAGETEKAFDYLRYYSRRRLLGEHVPYPVEAYPEGNQRHLSAESGLYCRIYTEGMFGMRPTGFSSFDCTPRLPAAWDRMSLRSIHAFGTTFDLTVKRLTGNKLEVQVSQQGATKQYVIKDGNTLRIQL